MASSSATESLETDVLVKGTTNKNFKNQIKNTKSLLKKMSAAQTYQMTFH